MNKYKSNVSLKGLVNFGKLSGGYFVSTIINNALPFLLLPVLTRYLTTADYGIVTLFTAYVSIAGSFTGSSVNSYIAKHFFDQTREQIAIITGNAFFITAAFHLVFAFLVILIYRFFPELLGISLTWALLIPVTSFSFMVFQMALGIIRNQSKVFTFGVHQIGNTATNALLSLLLVTIILLSWQGRVLGILLANLISAVVAIYYLKNKGFIVFSFNSHQFKDQFSFVFALLPKSLQMVMVSRLGLFFMQIYFAKELLGIYAVGFQISYVVMILITTLNLSWSPFFFKQLADKENMNKLYVTRMLYLQIILVLLGFVFVNAISGFILRLMTTPDFYSAKQFIPWLTLGMVFNGFSLFLLPVLIKQNQQKYITKISLFNIAFMFLAYFVMVSFFDYMGIVYAYIVTYVSFFAMIAYKSNDVLKLPWLRALAIVKR